MHRVEQSSLLDRTAAEVWGRAITEQGINDELSPILRMTMPELHAHLDLVIESDSGGCRVTDRLGFEIKRPLAAVPGSARLATAIVRSLFRHRHRRLGRRHGGRTATSS